LYLFSGYIDNSYEYYTEAEETDLFVVSVQNKPEIMGEIPSKTLEGGRRSVY